MSDGVGHVIVFKNGKRIDKVIPRYKLKDASVRVKDLQGQGVKAHLVYRTTMGSLPPTDEIEANLTQDRWWCPYCRTWRYFVVPQFHEFTEVGTELWFMNSAHRQGLRCCKWCHISEADWWVKRANGLWGQAKKRTRKKRR